MVTSEEEAAIRAFIQAEVGCPYDWWGIVFAQFLPWQRESPTAWFCSELVVAALKTQLPGMFPHKPCEYDPQSVLRILANHAFQWR